MKIETVRDLLEIQRNVQEKGKISSEDLQKINAIFEDLVRDPSVQQHVQSLKNRISWETGYSRWITRIMEKTGIWSNISSQLAQLSNECIQKLTDEQISDSLNLTSWKQTAGPNAETACKRIILCFK